MKLDAAFYRLPLRFDAARMHEEVQQFGDAEWRPHPQGFQGNSAVVLMSAHGGINDAMHGAMLPTAFLGRCPYIRQVFAAFDTVIGRARLMRQPVGLYVVRIRRDVRDALPRAVDDPYRRVAGQGGAPPRRRARDCAPRGEASMETG